MKMLKMLFAAATAVMMTLSAQAAKTAKAVVDDGGKTLRFVYDEADHGTKGTDWFSVAEAEAVDPYDIMPWFGKRLTVTKVVFDSSFAAYRPKHCGSWFCGFGVLAAVDGLKNLNTSDTANMAYMFAACSSLTTLDVKGFDTSKVTDMESMFDGCSSLTSLDVSGFNTANVMNMCDMFWGCSSLTSLDVTGFDTAQVTDMDYMFCNCSKLCQIDVSNFDTAQVADMSGMFANCSGLGMIVASEKFVAAPDGLDMFIGCEALEGGNGTVYDTSHTDGVYARIDKSGQPGYFTDVAQPHERYIVNFVENGGSAVAPQLVVPGGQVMRPVNPVRFGFVFDGWYADDKFLTPYDFTATVNADKTIYAKWIVSSIPEAKAVLEDGGATLRFVYDTNVYGEKDEDWFWLAEVESRGPMDDVAWRYRRGDVTKVVFDDSFAAYRPKTCAAWFSDFEKLARIDGIANLNTSEVTDMSFMFSCCESLTSLDVSGFDTAKVTDMVAMFQRCLLLPALDVSGFNTANVTDMSAMFSWCNSLTTLDLSRFHTAKVKDMNGLFNECQSLKSLDLSSFDTSEVTDMSWMFADCYALTSLVVTNFNAEKVTGMSYMFRSCGQLTELDVSNFDTAQVMNMKSMFDDCKSLKSLDLSGFVTAEVSDFSRMFCNCTALKTIIASNKFVVDPSAESRDMFFRCTQMVGGSGTKYNNSYVDAEYARIDKPGQPGYFTDPTAPIEDVDFTVTFVSHGGSAVSPQKVKGGTQAVRPPNPINSGYSFDGWYEDSGCQIPYDFSNAVNTDITLHAGWVLVHAARVVVEAGGITLRFVFDANNYGEKGTGWFSVDDAEKIGKSGDMPWFVCAPKVTKVIFDTSFAKYLPSTCTRWFEGFEKLQTVEVLNHLKTVNVTDMYRMFYGCSSLATLDLSDLSTWSVTNMNTMFSGCSSLASLDLTGFDTAQVTDMGGMFYGCSSLSSLDVSDFVTTKVTDMSAMFDGCSSLTALDLSNFDTAQVKNLLWMFEDCSSLETIVASENFVVGQDLVHETMFSGCTKLVGARGTAYDPDHVDATYARVDQLGQPGYFSDSMVSIVYTITFVSNGGSAVAAQTVAAGGLAVRPNDPTREGFDFGGWYSDDGFKTEYDFATAVNADRTLYAKWVVSPDVYTVTFVSNGGSAVAAQTVTAGGLAVRPNDPTREGFDFGGWYSDAGFKTEYDFATAVNANLTLYAKWNQPVAKVVVEDGGATLRFVFDAVDYGEKDSQWFSVADAEARDYLTSSPWGDVLSGTVTQIVIDPSFADYTPQQIGNWFRGLNKLEVIEGLANLDTSSITDMSYMFAACSALTDLDLTSFETTSVTNMSAMFYYCTSLELLDLRSFDTANVTTMDNMFLACQSLKKIIASDAFVTGAVTASDNMFAGCVKLAGGDGTVYDESKIDKTYARVDTSDTHGYFTTSRTAKAVFDRDAASLTFYYDDFDHSLDAANVVVFEINLNAVGDVSYDTPEWLDCTVRRVVFDASFSGARPSGLTAWFYGQDQLESDNLVGIAYLNTSKTVDMSWMFYGCSRLESVDVSGFDTSQVCSFAHMFDGCAVLKALDVSGFETRYATRMDGMFSGCSGLTKLDLSNFDTANVEDMSGMFSGCTSLSRIDLSSFNTANVGDGGWDYLFYGCGALETLDLRSFTMDAGITQAEGLFTDCQKLRTINVLENFKLPLSGYDCFFNCRALKGGKGTVCGGEGGEDGVYGQIDGEDGQPGYFTRGFSAKVVLENSGQTLRFVYDDTSYGTKDVEWFSVAEAEAHSSYDQPPWYICRNSVTQVIFDSSFSAYRPKHCGRWFQDFAALAAVKGMNNLDTSLATSLSYMFAGCSSLTSLDVSGFDTLNVTDMDSLFYGCSSLTSLDVTGFDTRNVTRMSFMFDECSSLTTLDVSGFDMTNTTAIDSMFYGCSSLRRIYAGEQFVTDRLKASASMFSGCTALVGGAGTTYDNTQVDATYARIDGGPSAPGYFTQRTAKVVVQNDGKTLRFVYDGENYGTKDTDWFSVAEGETINPTSGDVPWYGKRGTVTKVVFDKSFAVYQPTSVASWFYNFKKLTSVEGVRYWDTSKAKNFYVLFAWCSGLTTLDIAGLSTAGATSLESFFNGCTSLKTIYVDSSFVVSAGMNSNNMFKDCTSLVGGAGTVFDSGKTNLEYAYIDYGTARPGYFTALELRGVAVGTPDGRLVFYYDSESHAREGDVYSVWSAETTYPSPWSGECARFTAVEFTTSFLGYHPTSLSFWFKGSSALEHVNGIANLDTSAASGMVSMFDGCARLTKLDLSGFDTRNVTQMNDMFKNCSSLGTIIAGETFVTTALSQPSSDMFAGCTALVGGAGTTYDANHVDSVYARTDEPAAGSSAAVPGYFTRAVSARAVLADGGTTMRFVYDDAAYGAKGTDWFSVAEAETVDPRSHYKDIPWYGIRKQIAKVVIDPSFRSYRPKQCGGWFYEFTNLTTIEGLSNLATSEATSFCRMFASCRNLTELDLSGFETDSVEDAFQMFSTCSSLKTIIALESCTLSRAKDSTSMFANCTSLVGGAGTTYDADHVDADYARIDGGTTDPGYFTLTNRFYAVYDADASQLTFYYDAVKRGERVYESVRGSRPWRTRSSATGVVFDGSVAAYRPTSCVYWFSGFRQLESVSGLDALDVSAVTSFDDMFRRCLALRELDLSGFDTSSATSMSNMFADSTNLTTIIVSDGFTTANLRRAEPTMFAGCTALVGGAGTMYSPERVSSEFARIDGGPSSATPGYFTLKTPVGGYAAWAAEKGLTGADAAWDAKPAMWGGTWENGFIYTFGEGLADGTLAIMGISFDANGEPVITTTPVVEGHTDFTPVVIGTPNLQNWSSPVVLENKSGEDWTLPIGESANFFRVRLSE